MLGGGVLVMGGMPTVPEGNLGRRGLVSCPSPSAFRFRFAFGDAAVAAGLLVATAGDECDAMAGFTAA